MDTENSIGVKRSCKNVKQSWHHEESCSLMFSLNKPLVRSGVGKVKINTKFFTLLRSLLSLRQYHCVKYHNFSYSHGVEVLWKGTVSAWNSAKTVSFHKISTPGYCVKLRNFKQCKLHYLWAFACLKLTIETLEQGVKYVQS